MKKLTTKVTTSSVIIALITFICAFFITDNDSFWVKGAIGLASLVIFCVLSAIGACIAFIVSMIFYGIYNLILTILHGGFNSSDKPIIYRKKFLSKFFIGFIVFSCLVLAKFMNDFVFAQLIASFLFLSGAFGFVNGSIIAFLINNQKPKTYEIV